MDDLTIEQLEKAPPEIIWLRDMGMANMPIGCSTYQTIKEKYPEYFLEELQRTAIYESIPQEVQNTHDAELESARKYYSLEMPVSKGILHWIDNPEELKEWEDAYFPLATKLREAEKNIWNKYYLPYGLKFME